MRSRAFAAKRFRRSMELDDFKDSALSLAERRDDDDEAEDIWSLIEPVVEFEELVDVELADELVDFAIALFGFQIDKL